MPSFLEFLRIFSKLIFLLILPFAIVVLTTEGKPAARRAGLFSAIGFIFVSCYPILAVSISTVSAMTNNSTTTYTVEDTKPKEIRTSSFDGKPTDYPLRLSHYDPALGGTNCDHDCSTMASGDKVADWVGGRNGVYAAACPREWGWHHGKHFYVSGVLFECRDTGGWINCYEPGEYDPAMKTNATLQYCWVDLMTSPLAPYGTLTNDWR